jgi:hypothetical protein
MEAAWVKLASAIAKHNAQLGSCHIKISTDFANLLSIFSSMIQTCIDFDNSQSPFNRSERATAARRTVDPYVLKMQEFESLLKKLEPYQWKA